MFRRALLILSVMLALSFSISVVRPAVVDVQTGDVIDAGTIGPGQTVSLQIDPIVNTGGIHGQGGQYDYAIVEGLPPGWTATNSKLYQNPLQITITADPDAMPANYSAKVIVVDEFNGEKLGNISFDVFIEITYDVMEFEVTPEKIETGLDQPARFAIIIKNTGSTSDVFEVSATGSKRWDFKKPVFVPGHSSRMIPYEIAGNETEEYYATISVVSLASDKIHDEKNVTLVIKSTLLGDYKATNNGVVLFPIFQMPIYSLAGLLANLFG